VDLDVGCSPSNPSQGRKKHETRKKHYCLNKNDEQTEDFFYFRNTKNLFKHKGFRRRRENGSATMNDFRTCTISHLNMILVIFIFIEQVNIVGIIGEMMGGSSISSVVTCSNHDLRLVSRIALILIRKIKPVIALSSRMTWFKTYLTCNRG
jgi:hypothetical protein